MDQTAGLEDKVVAACTAHESAHRAEDNYRAAVRVDTEYFVKFGDVADLVPEIETQRYLSDYAMSNPGPGVPRIPRVLHWFQRGRTTYLVMEFVRLLPTSSIADGVTAALVWLASVPAPDGHVLGPLGGGGIRHKFFKDARAPLRFSDVGALQRYMDKVCPCFNFLEHPSTLREHATWVRRIIHCSRSGTSRPYLPSRYRTTTASSTSPTWTTATSASTSRGRRSCWISPR